MPQALRGGSKIKGGYKKITEIIAWSWGLWTMVSILNFILRGIGSHLCLNQGGCHGLAPGINFLH